MRKKKFKYILVIYKTTIINVQQKEHIEYLLYPNRPTPSENPFKNIYQKVNHTFSFSRKKRVIQENQEEQLDILLHFEGKPLHINSRIDFFETLHYFLENSECSIKNIADQLGKSYSKIQRTLKKHNYKPYKILPLQVLTEAHKRKRLEFCQQMIQNLNADTDYLTKILWTDESSFSTAGVFNRKNRRSWERKDNRKRLVKQIKKSGRKTVSVWCGIFRNKIVGPIFYDYILTGVTYQEILIPEVENILIQNFSEDELASMIWMQDGATPHNVLPVQEHLNNVFTIWIGNNGSIKWPPNSPDLTPMDSFFWGFLKDIVNNNNNNIQLIKDTIRLEIMNLNVNNEAISDALINIRRRYQLCIDNNGGHIEHLL